MMGFLKLIISFNQCSCYLKYQEIVKKSHKNVQLCVFLLIVLSVQIS